MRDAVSGQRESQDFTELLRKWTGRLSKPYVQALIRKLNRNQIEGMIPDEIAEHFMIQDQPDRTLLVVARDAIEAPAILQLICDADWEETLIARRLEADNKISTGYGDDNSGHSG